MSQTWQPKDSRKFQKWVKQQTRGGRPLTVYTIEHPDRRLAPYEDARLYTSHTFDWSSPITGNPMTGHMSAESLCAGFGPVYEEAPAGVRHMATPGPQVAGPVDSHEIHDLDEAGIRGLEKWSRDAGRDRRRRGFSRFH
ncbi:hypothetical protein [Streptomyces odontomachi]|uniref:hypothetical protein n=1 Tax=Streptomyces odontomachi TaxID=2944940 RepID=UPI00210B7D8F|nr:hypothetical protein [Streptomyces sp. ODS25]